MPLLINDEIIPEDAIQEEFHRIKSHFERTLQVACCERDAEFRGYAIDKVTARVLLTQEAKRQTSEPSEEEIRAAIDELYAAHGGEDRFYLELGIPYKDEGPVRERIINSLRVDQLLANLYGKDDIQDDAELQAWYQDHLDEFSSEKEIRVWHISKNFQGATSRVEVYEKMVELRKLLKSGADFMSLAEKENDQEGQEIDLGFFKRGEFMEEFEAIAFSLDQDEISPVFSTSLGYHLCVVKEIREASPLPFDEIKPKVAESLKLHRREEKFKVFIESLRSQAKIETLEGDEDEDMDSTLSF